MTMTQEHREIEVPASPRQRRRARAGALMAPAAVGDHLLALLSPLVATTAGWLVVDQRLTSAQIAGAVLVLVAMWLGQRRPQQQR